MTSRSFEKLMESRAGVVRIFRESSRPGGKYRARLSPAAPSSGMRVLFSGQRTGVSWPMLPDEVVWLPTGRSSVRVRDPLWDYPEELLEIAAAELARAAATRSVYVSRHGDFIDLTTVIDPWTVKARRDIYAAEERILDQFPDHYLHFRSVPLGRDPKKSDHLIFFRR